MAVDRLSQRNALPLDGLAAAWGEWQTACTQPPTMPEVWLDRLVAAARTDRQARRLRDRRKAARLPIRRDLLGFVWAETPLHQAQVEPLATAAFLDQAHRLILVGPSDSAT
ncbi:ATP-binding protein [uncultured Thiodictyon sp.]|jgi:hypothetical protein|uniref:ATP-binding protein n=1 Tax=uncultured Thiodictyon sp. TaxID=1846217 RepID=UPI0025E40C9D|nr:ATP-binding protein [uncultured Thiodictyon sp.]